MASHRFTVRLDDERAAWVDEQAEQRDRSRAWVIREAVDAARGADSAFGAVRTGEERTGEMDSDAVRTADIRAAVEDLTARLAAVEDALQEQGDAAAASGAAVPPERDAGPTSEPAAAHDETDSADADDAPAPASAPTADAPLDDAVADVLASVEAGADANRERLRREGVRVTTWLQAREGRVSKSDAVDAIAPAELSDRVWWERYAQPTLRQLADAGLVEYRTGHHDYRWVGPAADDDTDAAEGPLEGDTYDPTAEF